MNKFIFEKVNAKKVVKFKNLPVSHQLAIIQYMAFDGEAWNVPDDFEYPEITEDFDYEKDSKRIRSYIKKHRNYWVKNYGNTTFIPIDLTRKDVEKALKEFHPDAVLDGVDNSNYTEKWPVILSGFDDEFIEDGWHRLSVYFNKNCRKIPAIAFAGY